MDSTISDEKKLPKMLKEIEHCALDTSGVVSRTRKRKITTYKDNNAKSEMRNSSLKTINMLQTNEEENYIKNKDISNISFIDFDNKENSVVKSALKAKRKSSKVEQVKLFESKTDKTEYSKSDMDSYRTDEMDRISKRPSILSFTCVKCNEKFDSASQLNTHYFMHDFDSHNSGNPQTNNLETEGCTSSSVSSKDSSPVVKQRKLMSKSERGSEVFNGESVATNSIGQAENKYKCPDCSEEFSILKRFHFHQATSCVKARENVIKFLDDNSLGHFGCSICAENFKSQVDVQTHKSLKHADFKPANTRRIR